MKIYANRSALPEDNLNKFIGKDLWVLMTDPNDIVPEYWYIKILSASDYQIAYQMIHSDYVKNDTVPLYENTTEFEKWHFINRESPEEFFTHWHVCTPLEILSDDEVFASIIKDYV